MAKKRTLRGDDMSDIITYYFLKNVSIGTLIFAFFWIFFDYNIFVGLLHAGTFILSIYNILCYDELISKEKLVVMR